MNTKPCTLCNGGRYFGTKECPRCDATGHEIIYERTEPFESKPKAEIAIVFDGPPAPESGRFVEVEDANGKSISVGRWEHSADGYWRLWINDPRKADHSDLVNRLKTEARIKDVNGPRGGKYVISNLMREAAAILK